MPDINARTGYVAQLFRDGMRNDAAVAAFQRRGAAIGAAAEALASISTSFYLSSVRRQLEKKFNDPALLREIARKLDANPKMGVLVVVAYWQQGIGSTATFTGISVYAGPAAPHAQIAIAQEKASDKIYGQEPGVRKYDYVWVTATGAPARRVYADQNTDVCYVGEVTLQNLMK